MLGVDGERDRKMFLRRFGVVGLKCLHSLFQGRGQSVGLGRVQRHQHGCDSLISCGRRRKALIGKLGVSLGETREHRFVVRATPNPNLLRLEHSLMIKQLL
jgi:hypothetical protein